MFCKKCGLQIDDGVNFCEHCGADQRPVAEAQPQPPFPQPEQPQAGYHSVFDTQPAPSPVKGSTYLVWSILVTLICCLPLGIPAIVFAAKIDNCNARGDFAAAAQNAQRAKNFCIWGAIVSVIFCILYLAFMTFMIAETNFHF